MIYQEHELFIEAVKKFTTTELAPHVREWEKADFFPNEVFKKLGAEGYLGILIPEELGGIGGDYLMASAWCEAFGEICDLGLVTGVNMHSLVIAPAIAKLGTDVMKKKWIEGSISGDLIGAYAFTEPGAGSDLANIKTKAERRGDKWIINGAKTFITNGARADYVLLLTRTDFSAGYKGFTTFIIDTKTNGFKVSKKLDKLGWRSSDTAELSFEDVEVDDSCILGKVGDGWTQASNNLNWERLMLTLTTIGGVKSCIKQAVKYGDDRSAFGKKVRKIPGVLDLLKQMQSKLYAGELLTHYALELFLKQQPCKAEVSIAKRQLCEDALWIADKAIQIHGGYGYTKEFLAEKWWRDLRLMTIGGGTSEIMGNIVKKEKEKTWDAELHVLSERSESKDHSASSSDHKT